MGPAGREKWLAIEVSRHGGVWGRGLKRRITRADAGEVVRPRRPSDAMDSTSTSVGPRGGAGSRRASHRIGSCQKGRSV